MEKKKKNLSYLSYNVFTKIGEFLDVNDLTKLSMVSKQFFLYANQDIFYKKLYKLKWVKYS